MPAPVRGAPRTWRDDLDGEGVARRRAADEGVVPARAPRARPARRGWRPAPWMLQLAGAAALLALVLTLATLPPPTGPAVRQAVGRALDADLDLERAVDWARRLPLRQRAGQLVRGVLAPAPAEPSWVWPVRGTVVTPFGWQQQEGGAPRLHEGIDVAAPEGTPVVAAAAGRVRRVDQDPQLGLYVEIEHAGGWVTRYAQLATATVLPGDPVLQGQVIGRVGRGGEGGPHLHFELRVVQQGQERAVDPEPKLRRAGGS